MQIGRQRKGIARLCPRQFGRAAVTPQHAGGVQTVNLTNDTGLATVDLGGGFHTLNLAPADHNLSVSNVFTLNSFGTHNDTINFESAAVVNQTINLGFGRSQHRRQG